MSKNIEKNQTEDLNKQERFVEWYCIMNDDGTISKARIEREQTPQIKLWQAANLNEGALQGGNLKMNLLFRIGEEVPFLLNPALVKKYGKVS